MSLALAPEELSALARAEGFQDAGVARIDLREDLAMLDRWLAAGHHGQMAYLARHRALRAEPQRLHPNTLSLISVRMACLPAGPEPRALLAEPRKAYIARYALGRDYHRLMRARLLRLGRRLAERLGPLGYRVCADSAPVLEKALARNAGLGWIGKNTLLIHPEAGSFFLLGELLTDAPLVPERDSVGDGCGRCRACLNACPTGAFVGPRQLDARRCIAYLTIELRGPIPTELRPLIGNRIFGCDDCQLVCPWNRFAQTSAEPDFQPRHGLEAPELLALWAWDEAEWLRRTEGMALRRATWEGWRRNLAVALGNTPFDPAVIAALQAALPEAGPLVAEHIGWALARQAQNGQVAGAG